MILKGFAGKYMTSYIVSFLRKCALNYTENYCMHPAKKSCETILRTDHNPDRIGLIQKARRVGFPMQIEILS